VIDHPKAWSFFQVRKKSEKDDLSFVNALFQRGGLIKMRKMHRMLMDNTLYIPAKLLTIIGALNWGLVGLLNFNLVAAIFGKKSILSRLVYILVGLAGVYIVIKYKATYLAKSEAKKGKRQYSGKQYSWSGIQ